MEAGREEEEQREEHAMGAKVYESMGHDELVSRLREMEEQAKQAATPARMSPPTQVRGQASTAPCDGPTFRLSTGAPKEEILERWAVDLRHPLCRLIDWVLSLWV